MDSYLSNIDTYMQQQEQQEQLLKQQREQQQLLLQQQQQQQQNNLVHLTSQSLNDSNVWLNNIPGNALPQTPERYSNNALYMTNPSSSPSSYSTASLFNHEQMPDYHLQPPTIPCDIQEESTRQRKKPGRKPNPASPALRKAQNRAAQRAFRERKERHLKELETTIRNLRDQRDHATRELNTVKSHLESYKAESWYLKGVVLTLQFVCMHHNINIPTHSPYLSEEALVDMARTAPHAIEAYVNSYTRNNSDLNRTYQFIQRSSEEEAVQHTPSPEYHRDDECEADHYQQSTEDEYASLSLSPSPSHPSSSSNQEETPPISSSMDAIEQIRLKLGVLSHQQHQQQHQQQQQQQQQSNNVEEDEHLKPTILQLAIPHDPRIDLVPTPHMRDRMIIFRDQMDYDRCFTMLLNEAVYHGGDPTKSESWELPADFFSEFWYLTIDYDIKKTNKWRRIKGLADVEPGPQMQSRQSWNNDEARNQIAKDLPRLHSMTKESNPSSMYFYNMLMSEPPESRPRLQSPTLENIIDLMKSL